jgi:deoxyribonuclease-4
MSEACLSLAISTTLWAMSIASRNSKPPTVGSTYYTITKGQACYTIGEMAGLLFGTAGIPLSTKPPQDTIAGIKRIAELGLGCMEIEFVQKIYLNEAEARLVAEAARETGIKLSAHAPYFLNFNAHEPRKLRASQGIMHKAARIAARCGAQSLIFHAGFYLGDTPEQTYQTVKKYLAEVLSKLKEEDIDIRLRPEVSGKSTQFGTVEEILRLCSELEGVAPCIDFAHLHAYTGAFNSYYEFTSVLEQVGKALGANALNNMHCHISGIAYSQKGERSHLNLGESDLNYTELLRALKDFKVEGMAICESPNQEEDALLLKESYHTLPAPNV